uniref:Uncharacterized protein n=1 Tax=Arundo donax TaxID=35708 RepID=A0A0A9FE20_ARUDO
MLHHCHCFSLVFRGCQLVCDSLW